ncbi:MAG TPA: branched-chain amino acid ABC transporter permease [Thermoanaerobaculia bacterium]|nr:branched-chain amino acid ABC transporter permease [Thermoanaerobaculia bacterium]
MGDLIQLILSGVALGMIYALLAFGYSITFSTSRTINFAQGEFLMLGALTGLTIDVRLHAGYLAAALGAAATGVLLGIVLERVAIRPALRTGSAVSWILATVALGIVARNGAERIWGTDDSLFPAPLGSEPLQLGAIRVLPQELLVIGAAALIMIVVEAFRRWSLWGKAVTAVAADNEAAALAGINVPAVITASFVISSAIAAVSGVLVAPLTLAGPTMGILLGTKAYAVAIVGGLQSGVGVIVGGLLIGLSEQLTARYISTGYKDTPGFVLLILILMIKPAGIFGKRSIKKV